MEVSITAQQANNYERSNIMAPVSNEFGNSLSQLSAAIDQAEKKLRSIPASQCDSVSVELPYQKEETERYLQYSVAGLEVMTWDTEEEIEVSRELVKDLQVVFRIEAANSIPELIELAQAEEPKLKEKCDDVIANIQQSL